MAHIQLVQRRHAIGQTSNNITIYIWRQIAYFGFNLSNLPVLSMCSLLSVEDVVEEEVIAPRTDRHCVYDDDRETSRYYTLPTTSTTPVEPLSLVMERCLPMESATEYVPPLQPLRTSYSNEDDYYLEPRPPRNADSAPPSFGGT